MGTSEQRPGEAGDGPRFVRLRYGQVQRSAMNWPTYVAQAEGAFSDAGIDLAETVYPSTGAAIDALLAGELDVAHVVPDRPLSEPLRVVARVLDRPTYRLFGRPGRVGVADLSSGDGLLVRPLLDHLGIEGRLVAMGTPARRVEALLDGRIEATMVTEPFSLTLEDAAVPCLGEIHQALPDFPFAVCVVRGQGPDGLAAYLDVLRAARERLRDPRSAEVLAAATGCDLATAERVRRFFLRDGHLGRFEP